MQGKIRTQWIEKILCHQEYDFYGYFILCEHHFKIEDFEDGGKSLKIGSLPSIFPDSNSEEIYIQQSLTHFHEPEEYTSENIEPACESVNAMRKEPVCKNCTELNINLMKAKRTISLLERKISTQKKTIDENKKKLTEMQNEIANFKTKEEVR